MLSHEKGPVVNSGKCYDLFISFWLQARKFQAKIFWNTLSLSSRDHPSLISHKKHLAQYGSALWASWRYEMQKSLPVDERMIPKLSKIWMTWLHTWRLRTEQSTETNKQDKNEKRNKQNQKASDKEPTSTKTEGSKGKGIEKEPPWKPHILLT